MSADWELWGTFSVSDHLRPDPFAADVLLFDTLAIPTVTDDDVDRWESLGRDPQRQIEVLKVLQDLPGGSVHKVPWDEYKRQQFHDNYADPVLPAATLAATAGALAFDARNLQILKRENPDSDGQLMTRLFLRDDLSKMNDAKLANGVPPTSISIVAAYGTSDEMTAAVNVDEGATEIASDDRGLLAAFAWPFLVPESDGVGLDNLKRCVELANTQTVIDYRNAFRSWRGRVLRAEMTPAEAAVDLQDRIDRYAATMKEAKRQSWIRRAVVFIGLGAGLADPIFGLGGMATAGGIAGIVGAGTDAFEPVFGGVIRRRSNLDDARSDDIGAQFWKMKQRLT